MSNIEVYFLKLLKNIENKLFFVITWAYFQENIGHFDIHALTLRKIKRKWKKILALPKGTLRCWTPCITFFRLIAIVAKTDPT